MPGAFFHSTIKQKAPQGRSLRFVFAFFGVVKRSGAFAVGGGRSPHCLFYGSTGTSLQCCIAAIFVYQYGSHGVSHSHSFHEPATVWYMLAVVVWRQNLVDSFHYPCVQGMVSDQKPE